MLMMDLEKLTCAVCDVAKRAGLYIKEERKKFRQDLVESKHAHDYVSYVDKGSEALIVSALRKLLPQAGFITEEGSATYQDEQYCWVVDPLDGTTNFIHSYAPYCVSIALCQGRNILIGVVYEICADECYFAWKGGGAYLNGHRISVSQTPFKEALVGVELPYNDKAYSGLAHHLIRCFYGNVGAIRMNGSAAMSLCYVAAGRLDGWIEKYIGQWDFMAGAMIIEEAGGRVSAFDGNEQFVGNNEIVASNNCFHQNLLDAIASFPLIL